MVAASILADLHRFIPDAQYRELHKAMSCVLPLPDDLDTWRDGEATTAPRQRGVEISDPVHQRLRYVGDPLMKPLQRNELRPLALVLIFTSKVLNRLLGLRPQSH